MTDPTRRVALGIAYDGTAWRGWQTQTGGQTVQDALEVALQAFAGQKLPTICAGRTDTGVHALGQVVHVDAPFERDPIAWVRGSTAICRNQSAFNGRAPSLRHFMPGFQRQAAVTPT
ncbi:tRNA pseudouridine synthase TruA family protein [Orrella marina]|uniref:hypothetical protein n=1 Tax=Orrella marina TaxID=2163011 RepID=UPI001D131511|nr:hypothetical protein [Orrella marina]